MATPHASGIVALMPANPDLDPYEVKDILRNSSESRGSASETSVSDRWNDKWALVYWMPHVLLILPVASMLSTRRRRRRNCYSSTNWKCTDFDATINSPENGTY